MRPPNHRRALAVRVFQRLARLLLPKTYLDAVGTAQLDALRDAAHHRHQGPAATVRFWSRELGGLIRLAIRERLGWRHHRQPLVTRRERRPPLLTHLRADLGYALRMIRKAPLVSAVAILSIGLGIAGVVTGFAVLNAWLLRPLPYPHSERLVMAYAAHQSGEPTQASATPADFFAWREHTTSFEQWIAQDVAIANLTGTERPTQTRAASVTPSFFDLLGANPLLGRTFAVTEGTPSAPPVAVLGEQLWRNRMGADPRIVGQQIQLDGVAHTVVGVVPETFDFIYGDVDVWVASDFEERRNDRANRGLLVTARVRPGVSFNQAQSDIAAVAARLAAQYPETHREWRSNLQTLREQFPSRTDASLARILMVVTGLTLLVACANVAGVLLAKADARQREFAVRSALGAGRARILQQLLTESVLLATLAGALGVGVSYLTLPAIGNAIPDIIPQMFAPSFDGTVMVVAAVLTVGAGLTFGISPALHAIGGDRFAGLSDTARRASTTLTRRRLGSGLVVVEFAMALAILTGAGALMDIFGRATRVDPGYDPTGVLTVDLAIPEYRYGDLPSVTAHLDEIRRRLESATGVDGAAFATHLPRTASPSSTELTIEGLTRDSTDAFRASWLAVTDGYFELLGIPLSAGRTFRTSDRATAPQVAIVNQRFVDRHLSEGEVLGQRLVVSGTPWEIVGVVPDVAQTRMAGLEPTEPTVYFPLAQRPRRFVRALVHTGGPPTGLVGPVQRAIWDVDAEQSVAGVQTLEDFIAQQLAGPRFLGRFVLTTGLLALSLAALGVYGIVAFNVSRQSSEIGVRMALGARPIHVLVRVARRGAVLAGLGLLIGMPAALAVARAVMRMPLGDIVGINQLTPISPGTVLGVGGTLVAVALAACIIPARHAARVDPASALREA